MDIAYQPKLPRNPRPICIVGAGGIVKDAHLPAYRKAGFTVAGICDLNHQRAQDLAAAFDIANAFPSVDAMLTEPPDNAVYDIAIMAWFSTFHYAATELSMTGK